MKTGNPFTVRFVMEPKPQTVWGLNHAIWFYAMGVGGALFLLRALFGVELGSLFGLSLAHVVSQVLIGIGGLILIADLGKPFRFFRAMWNVRTSWIAWGAIADFVFLVVDALYILPDLRIGETRPLGWLPWADVFWAGVAMQGVAGVAAFIVIIYPGLVLASSPGIPLWTTMMIPGQYLVYAGASALGLSFLFAPANGGLSRVPSTWALVEAAFLLLCLLFLAGHLMEAWNRSPTGRLSVLRLFRGGLAPFFLLGCLGIGTLVPLGLSLGALSVGEPALRAALLVLAGLLPQVGNFYSKYCVIKAAMYAPIL